MLLEVPFQLGERIESASRLTETAAHTPLPLASQSSLPNCCSILTMVAQEDFTKPVRILTEVPAPDDNVHWTDKSAPGDAGTIEIRACSELTEHAAPVSQFSTNARLKCVQGFQGEPMVFAIGKGDVCLFPRPALARLPEVIGSQVVLIYHANPCRDSTASSTRLVLPRAGHCTIFRHRRIVSSHLTCRS
jgi:hypothetical protein